MDNRRQYVSETKEHSNVPRAPQQCFKNRSSKKWTQKIYIGFPVRASLMAF